MRRSAFVLVLVLSACVVGKPIGFGDGDEWTLPLVAPLENGDLLVPVKVNGAGPFLFKIDPDARFSGVDQSIIKAFSLNPVGGVEAIDERDREAPRGIVSMPKLEVGDLRVRNLRMLVLPGGMYAHGRQVQGLIGNDIIAESLIFEVNRDLGVAKLYTRKKWGNRGSGVEVKFENFSGDFYNRLAPRRIADVMVGPYKLAMHLDLGGQKTSVRPSKATGFKQVRVYGRGQWVDDLGSVQDVDKAFIVPSLQLGEASTESVLALPYMDKRWREVDIDGSVGNDVFARYHVTADWHGRRFLLKPREPSVTTTTEARIARWKTQAFSACQNPACVSMKIEDVKSPGEPVTTGSKPKVITLTVEPGAPKIEYEIVFQVGLGDEARRFIVTVPLKGRNMPLVEVSSALPPDTNVQVLDVSPFPRPCLKVGTSTQCIRPLSDNARPIK